MRRREVIVGLGAAAAWPLEAGAQQRAMPVIGFLSSRSPGESTTVVAAFRRGLAETGFVEGQNIAVAFRWAEGRYAELPKLAEELVGLKVAVVLAAGSTPSARAAKAASSTIPIVFSGVPDPVELGLVASLNRPGGNVTGMSTLTSELGGKSVEVLKEMLPKAARFAYLVNPSSPSAEDPETNGARMAARALGVELEIVQATNERELNDVFPSVKALRAHGLIVSPDPFFDSRRDRLVALSAQHALPAKYGWREYVLAGGLMSYGTDLLENYRRAGVYVGRILKGEKPADLPVIQPEKFELVINLKTAKALGLEVPPRLVERADEVIE
jgi:putative ABC transport system substrate-binding protein